MTNPADTPHAVPYAEVHAAYLKDWPVPYRLTPKAAALLAEAEAEAGEDAGADPGREPEAGT